MRTRPGIPTTYEYSNFRSRLEARWAAFFDLIGWRWTYEPFDSSGYIPDFLVHGASPFLVEVGPCVTVADYAKKGDKPRSAFPVHEEVLGDEFDQVRITVPEYHTLVVGVDALVRERGWRFPAIGYMAHGWDGTWTTWMRQRQPYDGTSDVAPLAHPVRCFTCRSVSIWIPYQFLMPCGHPEFVEHGGTADGADPILDPELNRLWRDAGNRVQWRVA